MLLANERRNWPIPSRPWALAMRWHDLLFAHWPVGVNELRPSVPAQLEIDSFDGQAWLGVVPFGMSHIRARCCPPLPGVSAFLEINVRTYVRHNGKRGVWFFSLDAANPLAVRAARRLFHLPYFDAEMSLETGLDGQVEYRSRRTHRGAAAAEFMGSYRPTGSVWESRPGSLEEFLTERYCLYAADPGGGLRCGDIHHVPWPLQTAEAEIDRNTMTAQIGLALPDVAPLLHFSRRLDVVAWRLERVDGLKR